MHQRFKTTRRKLLTLLLAVSICVPAVNVYAAQPEEPGTEPQVPQVAQVDLSSEHQTYMGGYIEIQPDSWGSIYSRSEWRSPDVVTGDIVEDPENDPTAWGFPYAFSEDTMTAIKEDMLSGNGTGIMYIRFPLGFAYRGYRNIENWSPASSESTDAVSAPLTTQFKDMTGNPEFDTAISWAAENGITTGWANGTFRPWVTCNRAAIITFLWRSQGKPEPTTSSPFSDMTGNPDFDKAITWASENGIATGWADGTFRPWVTCNRAAIVTFIWRLAGKPAASKSAAFKDMTDNRDFNTAISWAAENGITTGWNDGTFRPWNGCNRAAVVTFIYRYINNQESEPATVEIPLAKNIGERWPGQNDALKELFSEIAKAGGGLAPEYWCPAPYWLTGDDENGSSYSGTTDIVNRLWAGGDYSREISLAEIRTSDPEQYETQIDAFTDAIIDDLEYLEENIAEVKQFGLQNEPNLGYNTKYGHCDYDPQTYNDVLEVLVPKLKDNDGLSDVKINVSSEYTSGSSLENLNSYSVAQTFIEKHPDLIDLFSWRITYWNGRNDSAPNYNMFGVYTDEDGKPYNAANVFKSDFYQAIHKKTGNRSMFISEFEYMQEADLAPEKDDPDKEKKQVRACSNNMLRMIYELNYSEAEMLHPIIHLAKPKDQVFDEMISDGYTMFRIDMDTGDFEPNTWAYNSWKLFNDNLPFDAVMVGDYGPDTGEYDDLGWAVFEKDNQIYLFMANDSDEEQTLTLQFNEAEIAEPISFSTGKLYSYYECGADVELPEGNGTDSITFTIPANSGMFFH